MKKPNRVSIGYNEKTLTAYDKNRTINMMALLGYYYDGVENIDGILMIKFTDISNEVTS